MLEQYQEWNTIEQETMQEVIRRLLSQTFLLDRKYDKKSGRMASDREYEFCADHMAFLTEYFAVAGITIHQNYELGIIYIQGAEKQGERLTKLTTLYLLLLKLIYDEKMAAVSGSTQAFTTVGELNGKLGEFRLGAGAALDYRAEARLCGPEKISDGGSAGRPGGDGRGLQNPDLPQRESGASEGGRGRAGTHI